MPEPLYVETHIHADRQILWSRTQDPKEHQRWDLRFTRIDYFAPEPGRPQGFAYAFRLPWREVCGVGVSVGERERADGQSTSALRFASDDRLSPIASGHGWWRYVPDGDGIRFLTGYDYDVRWGTAGRAIDRAVFRPWMGWVTAWSFDRLRIWCERGVTPERSRTLALADDAVRLCAVGGVAAWVRGRLPASGAAAVVALAVTAAVALPAPASVPRARRCRRTPYDTLGRRAPTVAATLEPA